MVREIKVKDCEEDKTLREKEKERKKMIANQVKYHLKISGCSIVWEKSSSRRRGEKKKNEERERKNGERKKAERNH